MFVFLFQIFEGDLVVEIEPSEMGKDSLAKGDHSYSSFSLPGPKKVDDKFPVWPDGIAEQKRRGDRLQCIKPDTEGEYGFTDIGGILLWLEHQIGANDRTRYCDYPIHDGYLILVLQT